MATLTDEDLLELVERFDIPIEDTTTIERLQKALQEKLDAASGSPKLTSEFLGRFQRGLELKYEQLQPLGIAVKPIYRDIKGRFVTAAVAAQRDELGNIIPMTASGAYSVELGYMYLATKRMISPVDIGELLHP